MEAAFVFISLFLVIFGICYLYLSSRNKERLALIEKGADASIFISGRQQRTAPIWKILILNLSLLLMGIGVGVFIALILTTYTTLNEAVYPATIFFRAGIGLFAGFTMTKKIDKEN